MTAPLRLSGHVDETAWGYALAEALEHVGDCVFPASVNTYAQMRRDPALAAILAAYTLPIRRATWAVDPTGCRPEVAQLVADDLGLPVIGDDTPGAARTRGVSWAEHLRSALSHLTFGFAGFELLAEIDDNGMARLIGLFERTQATIETIHADSQGRLLGVSQDARGEAKPPQINADRLLWYAHEREGAAWQGTSLLRPAFGPWLIKKEMMRVHATANRRFGMGVPVARALPGTSPTPAQHAEAAKMAQAARVGDTAGVAMPPNYILELVGLTGSTPDTLAFLRWLDQQMSRMALAGFLDLGSSETGSRALGEAFIDLFTLSIQATGTSVADTVTRQAAARIVEWNWGTSEPVPAVTVADVGTKHEVTAQAIEQLMRSGALTPDPALEAYVRRSYRLPQRDPNSPPPQPNPPASTQPAAAANRKPSPPAQPAVTTKPRAAARRKRQSSGQLSLPIRAAADDGSDAEGHQADWETALAAFLAAWPLVAEPMVDELAAQAAAGVDAGGVALLAGLAVSAATIAGMTSAITGAMTGLAVTSAAAVVASAAAQGVDITAPDDPGADRIDQVATVTAALIAAGYASAAIRKALQVAGPDATAAEVADAVRETLTEMGTSQAGLVGDNVGGALSAAQSAGRAAVFEAADPQPTGYRANESLDKNTCVNCADAAGREYPTLAAALDEYPSFGLKSCLGGSRCRGFLVPRWS